MGFIENWKNGESAVGRWLAETVTGNIVKAAAAPVILWVGNSVADWNLPAVAMVAIVGAVPTLVNAINPADSRFGVKAGQ